MRRYEKNYWLKDDSKFVNYVLAFFLVLVAITSAFGQRDSTRKERILDASLTTIGYVFNVPRTQTFYQPTQYTKIDLHLNMSSDYNQKRKAGYTTLIILGGGFIAASILTPQYGYGNYQNGQYVIPPFWQQTPRVVMLSLGTGLTIGGTIGLINEGK